MEIKIIYSHSQIFCVTISLGRPFCFFAVDGVVFCPVWFSSAVCLLERASPAPFFSLSSIVCDPVFV